MDILFTNAPSGEEPEDETWVGDNALAVSRGASFLIDDDPKKDPEKPISKASIGDAPMGMKPTENPLEVGHINLSSRGKGSSAGVDTLIAKASGLGANPLGDNPLGLSPEQLELLGLGFPKEPTPKPVPAKTPEAKAEVKTDAKADVKPETKPEMKAAAKPETKPVPEPKKVEEPKEVSLSCIISASDDFTGGRIISGDLSFGSAIISADDPLMKDEDFKLMGESKTDDAPELDQKGIAPKEDDSIGLAIQEPDSDDEQKGLTADTSVSEEDPMGLMFHLHEEEEDSKGLTSEETVLEEEPKSLATEENGIEEEPAGLMVEEVVADDNPPKDNPSENKPKAGGTEEMDPLRALLLAGGNPFGDNLKNIAPDLSFGKDALKPKHFEPMKASGPKVNAENAQENNPLGVNPFGKEVVPDFSFGKEALKPKKYEPKKPFE